ncbi:MAG: chromate transporter [Spartobacteria bacterium]
MAEIEMKDEGLNLIHVLILFSSISLLSIGGGNTVIPEMHRKAVDAYSWMNGKQFADLFAISQAAPGPSVLLVTLIGYKAAGIAGAVLATIAMILPAGLLAYFVSSFWTRSADSPIRSAIEHGFAPLTVGLVLASGWVMGKAADHDWRAGLLTIVCTILCTATKTNPVLIVGGAAFIGWLGWL